MQAPHALRLHKPRTAGLHDVVTNISIQVVIPKQSSPKAETREFVFDPATQIGVGIDPGVTQAVSAASGVWDERSGQLVAGQLVAGQLARWKLTKGQVRQASSLSNSRCDTERWLAPIKPHLQHLAAASSAGTSLVANLKHISGTLATWDAVWELEEVMADVVRHKRTKQLVVFFGAATIGTRGGWGADAVLRACCKVVCRPRGTDQRRGRVVLVDEHRTTRHIGESRWRPPELCYWPEQGKLAAKGKDFPDLGYKRVRDKPPEAQQQQQQQQPAGAQ
ncbi:hypothetical protein QJQ45_010476 [Haematococcus lacustris]|nr:hypothetical protein QJQ45_010476 [Haematococcus lacustris]